MLEVKGGLEAACERTGAGPAPHSTPAPFSPYTLSLLPRALLLFCYLLKHDTGLLFSQRPHFPAVATPTPRASAAGSGSQPPASPRQPQKPTSLSLPKAVG